MSAPEERFSFSLSLFSCLIGFILKTSASKLGWYIEGASYFYTLMTLVYNGYLPSLSGDNSFNKSVSSKYS